MSQQLPLELQLQSPSQLDSFVAGNNQTLLGLLKQQLSPQGEPLIFISGEYGSGRSHLLMGQCTSVQQAGFQAAYLPCADIVPLAPEMLDGLDQLDLIAIDDVQLLASLDHWEDALFALFNRARDRGCRLLISADAAPGNIPFKLPDLQSRLSWGGNYQLQPLDDASRQQLLCSLAQRRGLTMSSEVARYLLDRYSRDSHSMKELIDRLDQASLTEQRPLTIPFVREQLAAP